MLEYLLNIPKVPSKSGLIRPPGAPIETEFLLTCKRCGECAKACEYGSIKIAAGDTGMAVGTPHLDLRKSHCRLCMKCIKACENGVLEDSGTGMKIGIAVVDQNLCISWNGGICTTCYSHCPEGAIDMDDELRPVINDKCTGCGCCESKCLKYPSVKVHTEAGSLW